MPWIIIAVLTVSGCVHFEPCKNSPPQCSTQRKKCEAYTAERKVLFNKIKQAKRQGKSFIADELQVELDVMRKNHRLYQGNCYANLEYYIEHKCCK